MSKDTFNNRSKTTQVPAAATKTSEEAIDLTDETLEKISGGCRKAGGEQEEF
jgi:hypothetical protein